MATIIKCKDGSTLIDLGPLFRKNGNNETIPDPKGFARFEAMCAFADSNPDATDEQCIAAVNVFDAEYDSQKGTR